MFDIQEFYEAKNVEDAVKALSKNENAEVISGGTDVLIRVREGRDAGKALVSIKNIEEMDEYLETEPMKTEPRRKLNSSTKEIESLINNL